MSATGKYMTEPTKTRMKVKDYNIYHASHIGSGAFGVIYFVTDSSGRKVAAKQIFGKARLELEKITEGIHRLLKLDSPNIVKFYDIYDEESTLWIFMEYCQYKDLTDFVSKHKLAERRVLDVMIQIAQGVEYIHENNVVHRDIKPSNVLISSDDPIVVKLTDFDFSKFIGETSDTSLMSTNVGTPAFKAPEFFLEQQQIQYHRNVDIYALGLTFLAMIQGNEGLVPRIETPYDLSELHQPIGRLIAERIKYGKSPLDVISKYPLKHRKPLRLLIKAMTCHEPEGRLSAAEVVKDLQTKAQNFTDLIWDFCAIKIKIPRHLDLQYEVTRDIDLCCWYGTRFTVMESGIIVLWGKTSEQTPAAFHLFHCTSTGFVKIREVKGLCRKEHEDWTKFQSLCVNNKELLAVSCWFCRTIRLFDVESEEVTIAFHDPQYFPADMCAGEEDMAYVIHDVGSEDSFVLELNTEDVPFTGPNKTIQQSDMETGLAASFHMCYIPSPHQLLAMTGQDMIRAVSVETGRKVWQVNEKVDGRICVTNGIIFSSEHHVLMVADLYSRRVLILHPRNGAHLQTISVEKLDYISDPCLHQNQLFTYHHSRDTLKISIFSVR